MQQAAEWLGGILATACVATAVAPEIPRLEPVVTVDLAQPPKIPEPLVYERLDLRAVGVSVDVAAARTFNLFPVPISTLDTDDLAAIASVDTATAERLLLAFSSGRLRTWADLPSIIGPSEQTRRRLEKKVSIDAP